MISILGKRKYKDAFNQDLYEDLRYGGHIDTNFFKNGGVGHGVKQANFIEHKYKEKNYTNAEIDEIHNWCYEYLESKKKSICNK